MPLEPLPPDALAWRCEPDELDLDDASAPGAEQERAEAAIRLALAVRRPGYNLMAIGPDGIGRHALIRRLVDARAATEPPPSDWCYVSNVGQPRKPRVLRLAAGRGARLQADMAQLVGDLRDALRNAFENEEYRTRRQVIEDELKERQEQAIAGVEAAARAEGVALLRTPMGLAFAPTREGRVIGPEEFQQLPEEARRAVAATVERLQEELRAALAHGPAWLKETRERVKRLNDETARFAVDFLIDQLKAAWADVEALQDHLEEVRWDVIGHVELFLQTPEPGQGPRLPDSEHPLFRRYQVNLLVDNAGASAAPVVYEDDPSFERLIGRIEYRAEMGTLTTDFLLVRGGALHRANGGYVLLDARKLLTRPMAWDVLKRTLTTGELRIESPLQTLGLLSTVTLEPEPIPFDAKVVLIGERLIHLLLSELDPDFARLFKVVADFDDVTPRSPSALATQRRRLHALAAAENLRPLAEDAIAALLEHAARRAGDSEKLSLDLETLSDLVREADHQAALAGAERIARPQVEAAIEARRRRFDRAPTLLLEAMQREVIRIATSGAAIGQINGLSVYELGGVAFGRPSRITARIRLGGGQVLDIERETKLGGPLHTKGVLILSGFLGARYARDTPLALHASLVFEQSYGGVDGDSASAAEALALLSALAELPLRQDLAITGSIDQHGAIQAIGGVNEKIEGFFDLCAARGLDGSHGVVIPTSNRRNLMLHRRVREAAAAGQFRVWAITHIDEAIELFFGRPAGERGTDGAFHPGSVNAAVEARLRRLAEMRRAFGRGDGAEGGPPAAEARAAI
jgi:lon-related putative ATP-dependent protease